MTKSRQIVAILVVLAIAIFWMNYGLGDFAGAEQAGGDDVTAHLEQAATSVIAAAKESIQSASSDDEAAQRVQVAVEALRMIGMLGDVDTGAQTEKLLDDLQSVAKPAVAEEIIQLRLARQLQQ
jgi:zona occludens toxin (predicted ATPase)